MTRLWTISDLHFDHGRTNLEIPADADVAVIAGDVVDDGWLAECASTIPTVFVAGNHEFYRNEVSSRLAALSAIPGLHHLNNSDVKVSGVRFIGCTLWTNYNGGQPYAMETASRGLNDHRLIKWRKDPYQRFLPRHALQLHRESVAFLEDALVPSHSEPTVVVTHHAPSLKSVAERYRGQELNWAYVSDLEWLVAAIGARYWIHGHVHDPFSYMVGETRVLCNPHGYPHEADNGFGPAMIVEV
jgi:predicted phosphodiesterase